MIGMNAVNEEIRLSAASISLTICGVSDAGPRAISSAKASCERASRGSFGCVAWEGPGRGFGPPLLGATRAEQAMQSPFTADGKAPSSTPQ
jgi:hypothetical protein